MDNFSLTEHQDEFSFEEAKQGNFSAFGDIIKGDKGDPGAVFTPSVDSNGNISWTNDGGLPNPETQNIKGPQGDPGNYTKPATGIPKTDLAEDVQTSLGKADAALPASGGTMSGAIAMGGNRITGIANGTNDQDAVTKAQLDAAVVGALKPSGSIAFASLPALSASVLNNIYNITDAFTTTSDFVEGSGKSYPAGTNVAVINTGAAQSPVYKFDVYTGVIDLSAYRTAADQDVIDAGKYEKPAAGIPEEDLSQAVRNKLNSGGVSDYADLNNKPGINGVTLSGNKTAAQLGLAAAEDVPTKTSQLQNDAGFLTQHQSLAAYRTAAAQDMIDATKQAKIAASGMLKGDGNGTVTAATAGTDYQAPLIAGTDYETPAGAKALGLTGALAGDLVRVNAVDANGRPTSWKHVPLNEIKCNKNLLDNWYFIGGGSQLGYGVFPINQRGQTSYSNTGYTFDRWKLTSGSMTIAAGGITLNGTLEQILEANIGQTVTASALLADGTMITPVYNDTTKTFTLTATGQTIKAVKLELGSEQTLAHQENGVWVLNEIPNYQTELTKCMAYFQRIGVFNDWKFYNCVVRATGSSGIICLMAIPIVPMRNTPTVTTSSTELQVVNYPGGPGSGIGTIKGVFEVGYSRGDGLINIQFNCANSLTVGKVAYAFIGSNGSGSIDLSAE